jgi:signal transduction histidine kinase
LIFNELRRLVSGGGYSQYKWDRIKSALLAQLAVNSQE